MIWAVLIGADVGEMRVERDSMPSAGISSARGPDELLLLNRTEWQMHRKVSAKTFRQTVFLASVSENSSTLFGAIVPDVLVNLSSILRTSLIVNSSLYSSKT